MRLFEVWTAAFFGVFAIFAAVGGWVKFCLDHDDKWWWYPLFHIAVNWAERGWQACAAEYQPQLTELRRLLQEVLEMYPQTYSCEPGAFEMTHINPEDWKDVRSKIEDVLDRSGARGGSVAASPASSPDNPPTTTDRSGT